MQTPESTPDITSKASQTHETTSSVPQQFPQGLINKIQPTVPQISLAEQYQLPAGYGVGECCTVDMIVLQYVLLRASL